VNKLRTSQPNKEVAANQSRLASANKGETKEEVFWKIWLSSDELKQVELIKQLPIYNNLRYRCVDVATTKHIIATLFNSYLLDLYRTIKANKL